MVLNINGLYKKKTLNPAEGISEPQTSPPQSSPVFGSSRNCSIHFNGAVFAGQLKLTGIGVRF
uniref:Uncharacterized protein n=1 Tax=Anguilla anguilla TaxID=7936 RepID=A0A0E9XMZ7_ANGAN